MPPRSSGSFEAAGLHAPAGLGRRYGALAGDVNPIHIADVAARAFGFRAAIAALASVHGWRGAGLRAAGAEPRAAAPDDRT